MPQREEQSLNAPAIERLYIQHAPLLLRYIHRSIFSQEDADDVLVEVFLAAIESRALPHMGTEEQLAWLRRVTHNKIVDYQRKVIKTPVVVLDDMRDNPFHTDLTTPEHEVMEQEEAEELRAHLSSLPPLQQQVLRLRFGEGLRTKEIALQLRKSDGAIRSLLLRSLNLLRNLYNAHEEEGPHD